MKTAVAEALPCSAQHLGCRTCARCVRVTRRGCKSSGHCVLEAWPVAGLDCALACLHESCMGMCLPAVAALGCPHPLPLPAKPKQQQHVCVTAIMEGLNSQLQVCKLFRNMQALARRQYFVSWCLFCSRRVEGRCWLCKKPLHAQQHIITHCFPLEEQRLHTSVCSSMAIAQAQDPHALLEL